MTPDLITINGKSNNYAVDLEKPFIVNWSQIVAEQEKVKIYILDEKQKVIFEKQVATTKNIDIKLKADSGYRKKYTLKIVIQNKETVEVIKKNFYSSNSWLEHAYWITRQDNPIEKEYVYYKNRPSIILKNTFIIENETEEFFLDICGLGYYTTYVNGQRIDEYYLNSDVTNYKKCVYYDTFKLNPFISKGKNEISVELANGWFNPAPLKLLGKYNMRHRLSIGKPMLICSISRLSGGRQHVILKSDNKWMSEAGERVFDNLYIGEKVWFGKYDAEKSDKEINMNVIQVAGPAGKLVPSMIPKIKRVKKRVPLKINKVENGYIVDFGRIISGQISLEIVSKKQKIKINYAEKLGESKEELDYSTTTTSTYGINDPVLEINENETVIQEDLFFCKDGLTLFENEFSYHSFRYLKIIGEETFDLKELKAYDTYTDMQEISTLQTSDSRINKLHNVAVQTKKNNIHAYYEDCARERLGYGGDLVALIESQICTFDSEQLLKKVLFDFIFDQTDEGGITQTAPYVGIQTFGPSNNAGSLGWQMVLPIIVLKYIKYYGKNFVTEDEDVKASLVKHLDYLLSFDYEYIKYCCLGDWGSIDTVLVDSKETPPDKEFCSAAMYLILLQHYQQLSSHFENFYPYLDKLEKQIKKVKEKIISEYYDETSGFFQSGSQSSYIFAIKAGLDKQFPELIQQLEQQIQDDHGVFRMGIFGMAWTYEFLNVPTLIYDWLTRNEAPSFNSMLSNGNFSLSEYFEDMVGSSLNHAMFTSYSYWFISCLLGLRFDDTIQAAEEILIDPYIPDDLDFVEGSLKTIHGEIKLKWEKKSEKVLINIQIPLPITYNLNKSMRIIEETITDNIQTIVAIKKRS